MAKIKSAELDAMVKNFMIDVSLLKVRCSFVTNSPSSNKNQVRKMMLLSVLSSNMLINVHSNVQTLPIPRKIKIHTTSIRDQMIIGTKVACIRENAFGEGT